MSNEVTTAPPPEQRGKGYITLFVNGTVITGRAVKLAEYFRATMIPDDAGPDFDVLREIADRFEKEYADVELLRDKGYDALTDKEKELADAPLRFVNLLDARFQIGSGALAPTSERGIAIRVRFSSVDAWTMGELS